MPNKRPKLVFQDDKALLAQTPERNALLDKVKSMGGKFIQVDTMFGNLHNANGYSNFQPYDSLVNEARKRGLGVRMRLMGTPTYLQKSNPGIDDSLGANHPNAHLMGDFAKTMAQHFKGRVGGYSIWNEPNVGSFLNRAAPQAASEYRRLYRAGYGAIKGVSKYSSVGLGELTSQSPNTPGDMSTIGFMKNILKGGKPLKADYFAVHPYQWSDPKKKVGNEWYGGISNLPRIQQELKDQFRRGRLTTPGGKVVPLSISEYGYKHDAQGNQAIRAKWLSDSYRLAQKAGVKDFNMYQLMPSPSTSYWDSSILGKSGDLSPAMRIALQRMRRG